MQQKGILINQIGYLKDEKKYVLFKKGNIGDTFKVVCLDDSQKVYEGKIADKKYSDIAAEEVCWGEFSEVNKEGKYKIIVSNGEESYEFRIGERIYKDAFKDIVRFFYLQRCGEEIPECYGKEWSHPACHSTLARVYGTDKLIDVTGGWHDAGDYGRYTVATAKTVADLFLAYEENPKAFEKDFDVPREDKQLPYILEEIKRQLIWMKKMQDEQSGGVYHKVTCAHFPGHDVMPEDEVEQLIISPISTDATGSFIAVMAMAYEKYQKWDTAFADECLKVAERAWEYLIKAPSGKFKNPEGITTGEYGGKGDQDSRYWAAAQLFKATGDKEYKEKAELYAMQEDIYFGYGWTGKAAYGDKAYLQSQNISLKVEEHIKERIKRKAENVMKMANEDGYRIHVQNERFSWGSNMDFLILSLFLTDAYEFEKKECYLEQARRYIDYCFGMNPLGICYITGYGSNYSKYPHHRPAMATKATIPGMLVGGPCWIKHDDVAKEQLKDAPAAKCYIDDYESYSTNEVDIYWNSTLVWALARMNRI